MMSKNWNFELGGCHEKSDERAAKLKGIGEVLSRRLVESSYDTIAKVAAAEEKGLERIEG